MSTFAFTLKSEIARIARGAVNIEAQQLKTLTAKYRVRIKSIRKQIQSLESRLRTLRRGSTKTAKQVSDSAKSIRFSASRLAAHHKRLGLSAREMGAPIGVFALSIYKWEADKVRPRKMQLQAIANVKGIGKRGAAARLEIADQVVPK